MARQKALIKLLKRLIKQDYLYTDEKLREMKQTLRIAEEEFAEYATKAGMSELEQQKIKDANRFLELNQSLIDAEKAGVLEGRGVGRAVSYTHLTLPTICSV